MNETHSAWPAGIKKTKQRASVLKVLENAPAPISAMELYECIEKEDSPVWLSTVYRILEMFVSKGFVMKTTVMDNDMAVYELNRNMHMHYAVCVDCHKIVAMNNCPMAEFTPKLADDEFHVLGHRVEMYGYCKDCDKNKNKDIGRS